jgi:hypothetical protein
VVDSLGDESDSNHDGPWTWKVISITDFHAILSKNLNQPRIDARTKRNPVVGC